MEIDEMDAYQVAIALEEFARTKGFVAPQAYYIVGGFNLKDAEGESVYSDEAHLWCKQCAEALLKKARSILPKSKARDHFVCSTDATNEDTCPHCMSCGETLDGSVSDYAVEEEIAYYLENPITPSDIINPRQAVEIAQILWQAGNDPRVVAIGKSALSSTLVSV